MEENELRQLHSLIIDYRNKVSRETTDDQLLTSLNIVQQNVSLSIDVSRTTKTR